MDDGLKNGMESLFSWEKIRSARKKGDGLPIRLSKTNRKPGKKSNRRATRGKINTHEKN